MNRAIYTLGLWVALFASPAFAQTAAKFEFFTNSSGVRVLVPAGQPPGYGQGQLIWDNAMRMDGGLVEARGVGKVTTPSNRVIDVQATTRIPSGSVGAALGRFAQKVVTPLAVGVALYDLGKELGFTLENSTGQLTVLQADPTVCTVAPCTGWRGYTNGTVYASREAFLSANFPPQCRNRSVLNGSWTWFTGPPLGTPIGSPLTAQCPNSQGQFTTVSVPPSTAAGIASSLQDFTDFIATKSGWPSSSKVGDALKDAIASGETVDINTPTVSGPATSPGPITVVNNSNGTTTTTSTVHNHNYTTNNVTTNTVKTTVVSNTSTGDEIGRTVETETPPGGQNPPMEFVMPCGVAGSPPCNVKIDETGMPPPPNLTAQETALDASKDGVLAKITDLQSWTPGEWTWTFSLPTGCAPLPMYLGVTVDVCQWQSVMHNIMGMIWALTGIAGLFAIFNRAD
jgi:hypothetical protein